MSEQSPSVGHQRTSVDCHLDVVIRNGSWPDISPFTREFLRAVSFDDLKLQFRAAIMHFGFHGYAYWGADPTTRFALCGTSDLADRFGNYLADCSGLMETIFSRFDPAVRERDNNWKISLCRPALECVDTPQETRSIHTTLCRSVTELDMQAYRDVLIVPTGPSSVASHHKQHVHLPMRDGTGSADIVAAVALVKIFDSLARDMPGCEDDFADQLNQDEVSTGLTSRELAVLRSAATGLSHIQIAEKTGLRRGEVRYCLESARERYGFATTIQAIVKAAKEHGWTSDS